VLLALYAASAPRTVALEDDAFFILASHFLGVAHPPGYPLHTLLGKLATLLPLGSVAYRVHLLSAACGAASCALLWLGARTLGASRAASWLAALGLGVSPAFWSQSIIAEVYTLNTLFFFGMLLVVLRGGPLAVLALLFGLSLANHWPLTLLCAPALAVLAWPRRAELLGRLPLLLALAAAGLVPYAWMVWLSRTSPIAFYGPIESLGELWFYVSRQGYAGADASVSAGWHDRVQFLAFLVRESLVQFAVAGILVAAAGAAAQWRAERRVAVALALAILMPTAGLVLLLGFDYDVTQQNVFRVYPLPAWGALALWMALGVDALARRWSWRPGVRVGAAAILVLAIGAVGAWRNVRPGYDWSERYARAVLESLPPSANLVTLTDAELGPIAYFHLVEGLRPDVKLHHAQGLLLGNRLFHPMRSGPGDMRAALHLLARTSAAPSAFMNDPPEGFAQRHRGWYVLLEPGGREGPARAEITPQALDFLDRSLLAGNERDPWTRLAQQTLRGRFAAVLAASIDPARPPDAHMHRRLGALAEDYVGALGLAEGLLSVNAAPRDVARALEQAAAQMPGAAPKDRRARFFELRAYLRLNQGDRAGAVRDLETALAVWPSPKNRASVPLADLQASRWR
jgi:hypothetical protein